MEKTKNFVQRFLSGDTILIPRGRMAEELNGTIALSDTAAFIYENADCSASFEELLLFMSTTYRISPKQIEADLRETLTFMISNGILEESDKERKW